MGMHVFQARCQLLGRYPRRQALRPCRHARRGVSSRHGSNHPRWPSLGLIHGSRSSGDINRSWPNFASTARQNLLRAWQNGKLWWNDPDCVVLVDRPAGNLGRRRPGPPLTDAEYQFHATAIYACGGLILDGDDFTRITPNRRAMLEKLLPPTGQ